MIAGGCLCRVLPTIDTETRMVVVCHVFEQSRTTNTAHLAQLMLPQLRIVPRGGVPGHDPDPSRAWTTDRRVVLLYPDPAAPVLTADWAHRDPRPVTLVVPDGSWPQARRAARRSPALAGLPRLRLPDGPPTRFWLRDQTRSPQHLCTLEALARALGIIEGHRIESMLLQSLDAFVQQILASRGRLRGPQALTRATAGRSGGP